MVSKPGFLTGLEQKMVNTDIMISPRDPPISKHPTTGDVPSLSEALSDQTEAQQPLAMV